VRVGCSQNDPPSAHRISQRPSLDKSIGDLFRDYRDSISQLFAVLKTLMKAAPYACEKCQSTNFQISEIKKNTVWIFYFIILPKLRGPPKALSYPKKASACEKQKFIQNRYAIMDRL